MFDPTIGRWLQEDPIEFEAGDPNLYRYVENNALNMTDLSGLEPAVKEQVSETLKIDLGNNQFVYLSGKVYFRGTIEGVANKDDGVVITTMCNSEEVSKKLHFFQIVMRTSKAVKGDKPTPAFPIEVLDERGIVPIKGVFWSESGRWRVDTFSTKSLFYEYKGTSRRFKTIDSANGAPLFVFEMSDGPGLFKTPNTQMEEFSARTFLIYEKQFLAEVKWRVMAERDANGYFRDVNYMGMCNPIPLNGKRPGDLPLGFDFNYAEWFWLFTTKELDDTKVIKIKTAELTGK